MHAYCFFRVGCSGCHHTMVWRQYFTIHIRHKACCALRMLVWRKASDNNLSALVGRLLHLGLANSQPRPEDSPAKVARLWFVALCGIVCPLRCHCLSQPALCWYLANVAEKSSTWKFGGFIKSDYLCIDFPKSQCCGLLPWRRDGSRRAGVYAVKAAPRRDIGLQGESRH